MTKKNGRRVRSARVESPTPQEVCDLRLELGLSQERCGSMIHVTKAAWCQYELGVRSMHPGLWELFRQKAARHQLTVLRASAE